jgi:hypothetical protein
MKCRLLFLFIVGVSAHAVANSPDMFLTNEVIRFVTERVRHHEPAFISECKIADGTKTVLAAIIFFPRSGKGMFIVANNEHVVSNNAGVIWDADGKWDMSELEGGIETIRLMSNVFDQLTRQSFKWASPVDVRRTWEESPTSTCTLARN